MLMCNETIQEAVHRTLQDDDDIDEQKESVAYGHICVIPLNGEKYDQQT